MNGYSVWAIGQRADRGKDLGVRIEELGEGSSALFLSRPRPRFGVNALHAVKVQVFNAPIRLLRKHACTNLQRTLTWCRIRGQLFRLFAPKGARHFVPEGLDDRSQAIYCMG
jgi:hypothetical protein